MSVKAIAGIRGRQWSTIADGFLIIVCRTGRSCSQGGNGRRQGIGENTPSARPRCARIGLRPPQRPCRAIVEPLIGIRRENGRRERIRTSGPYVPNVVLYQAELLSDMPDGPKGPSRGSALIAMPLGGRNQAKGLNFGSFAGRFCRFSRVERPGGPLYGPGPDHSFGASPSGKALDFDSSIRRFDPFRPSQFSATAQNLLVRAVRSRSRRWSSFHWRALRA